MEKFSDDDLEIEVRFIEVNVSELTNKLVLLGARDEGEDSLEEIIFYDKDLTWQAYGRKFVRIRKTNKGIFVTYKHQAVDSATGTEEIEFRIENIETMVKFLERIGLVAYRRQQKKRHKFLLGDVIVDFDTWPKVPTYVELEGPSEEALKRAARDLGFDWGKVIFENPRALIKKYYSIPVENLRWFTFDRIE